MVIYTDTDEEDHREEDYRQRLHHSRNSTSPLLQVIQLINGMSLWQSS